MPDQKIGEAVTIEGVDLIHTYRGYDNDIEVYTAQAGNRTYSLYRKANETTWKCDWTTSYNCQPVDLSANPGDKEATLKAFVALLKSLQHSGH